MDGSFPIIGNVLPDHNGAGMHYFVLKGQDIYHGHNILNASNGALGIYTSNDSNVKVIDRADYRYQRANNNADTNSFYGTFFGALLVQGLSTETVQWPF